MTWLLLIYTVPAEPSRARAAVWREVKKAGAVYLRDGVCALPENVQTVQSLRSLAQKVEELGGRATLARSVKLDDEKSQLIADQARQARLTEYADLQRELSGFIAHVRQERSHREFRLTELELLESDFAKLRQWYAQIVVRDFAASEQRPTIEGLIEQCESELHTVLVVADSREETLN